jgi:hypothetical protein
MSAARKPVVFLGPTLKRSRAEELFEADFRGPAAMGDITRATASHAEVIVLIDGIFESAPSVWHKEILWAISRSVTVIGAASMGALRAAELHNFGMLGHGRVFESYASGLIEDDDEVAVVHGPSECGWHPLTDAMVDIRDYALQAAENGLLSNIQSQQVVEHAKAQHFKNRTFLSSCLAVANSALVDVSHWFSTLQGGVKTTDCTALLSQLPAIISKVETEQYKSHSFVPTIYLSRLQNFGFHP